MNVIKSTTECPLHAKKQLAALQNNSLTTISPQMNHHHHHHHNHGIGDMSGNSSDGYMMKMYFHGGFNELILFDFWYTESVLIFVISCIALFIIAALYEGIKLLREVLIRNEIARSAQYINSEDNANSLLNQANTNVANNNNNPNDIMVEVKSTTSKRINTNEATCISVREAYLFQKGTRLLSRGHIIQTFLHMFQMTISYMLMLVFMTYNSWLCLSVILGAGFGYFFFGYKRLTTIDANEHCH